MSRFDAGVLERALRFIGKPAPEVISYDLHEQAIDIAAPLGQRFERFMPAPYLCPAGVVSIGFGATFYADFRRVTMADRPISFEAAVRLQRLQLERVFLPAVLRQCPNIREPRRLAAILDFTFNLGEGHLAASTLRRRVNAEDWAAVPAELRKWIYGGGKALRGLVLRREVEAALI